VCLWRPIYGVNVDKIGESRKRKAMNITVLVENKEDPSDAGLIHEHGLSLYLEFDGKTILFYAGATDAFSKNADVLGIDLSSVDAAVLSHHHYDHCGGLSNFLEKNKSAKIYLRENLNWESYFRAFWFIERYVGLDESVFENHPDRFIFVDEIVPILPDVYIIPKIETVYPKPKGNKHLFVKTNAGWELDDFEHELILVIKDTDGLVVFSGCSHNGIVNMIDKVSKVFPEMPIKAVIGGFHLIGLPKINTMAGSRTEVEEIAKKTLSYNPTSVYSGHCTGKKAYRVLIGVMGETLSQLHTGAVISI